VPAPPKPLGTKFRAAEEEAIPKELRLVTLSSSVLPGLVCPSSLTGQRAVNKQHTTRTEYDAAIVEVPDAGCRTVIESRRSDKTVDVIVCTAADINRVESSACTIRGATDENRVIINKRQAAVSRR